MAHAQRRRTNVSIMWTFGILVIPTKRREMVQSLRTPVPVVPPALPPLPSQQVVRPAEMAELVRASHPPTPALHTLQELAKVLRS